MLGSTRYIRYLRQALPEGAEVYLLGPEGALTLVRRGATVRLDPADRGAAQAEFLRFIDDGQYTRYLIGGAATSSQNPSNATYKLGVVRPHSAFTPHAHGAEHYVLSTGYALCGLYDQQARRTVNLRLPPGTLLRIPPMLPHSFANRAGQPLLIVVANTGMGIDHADYAITAAAAEQRDDLRDLAAALRQLESELPSQRLRLSWRERAGALLHRLASAIERS